MCCASNLSFWRMSVFHADGREGVVRLDNLEHEVLLDAKACYPSLLLRCRENGAEIVGGNVVGSGSLAVTDVNLVVYRGLLGEPLGYAFEGHKQLAVGLLHVVVPLGDVVNRCHVFSAAVTRCRRCSKFEFKFDVAKVSIIFEYTK